MPKLETTQPKNLPIGSRLGSSSHSSCCIDLPNQFSILLLQLSNLISQVALTFAQAGFRNAQPLLKTERSSIDANS